MEIRNICVIGMWHLGCVTAACLAHLGFRIECFDFDRDVLDNLRRGKMPVHEPGLDELFDKGVSGGMIHFTSDIKGTIPRSDAVYITFDTPTDEQNNVNLRIIHKTIETISPLLAKDAIILISSQIPVGTSDRILERLRMAGKSNELCYIPENLQLGNALNRFMKPERIIFGLSSSEIRKCVEKIFSGIKTRYFFTDLRSAEMSKHVLNSYLATMISFSGEISDLCEKVGANAIDVMKALKSERRVGEQAPITPGLGFGGGTLARDVQILRKIGNEQGIGTVLLDAVIYDNDQRMRYVYEKLLSILGSLEKKKIAFLGLTYKAGTSTLRKSLSLQAIDQIRTKNVSIKAYDPMIKEPIEDYPNVKICKTVDEAVKDADAVVITTDWDEFKKLDYIKVTRFMKTPVIIDTKNMLNRRLFKNTNIKYYGVGVSCGK